MISLLRQIQESENSEARAKALLRAFVGLTSAVPKTALPASAEVAEKCRETLEKANEPLRGEPRVKEIDHAGAAAVEQVGEIHKANRIAIAERDAAIKEVVETVAWAVGSFKGFGERHKTSLTKLADGFDALSRVEDVGELRRRLREDVKSLRDSVEQMRRESEDSVRRLESQVTVFQERVEQARKDSSVDRLTGLANRREAERSMQKALKRDGSVCLVVFDIEKFGEINAAHGTLFGDKILRALTHTLRERFPGEGTLFRWGADEFVAIAEGSHAARLDQARGICESFAASSYYTSENGIKRPVNACVACGVAPLTKGESGEDWYRRARESLELNRRTLRP